MNTAKKIHWHEEIVSTNMEVLNNAKFLNSGDVIAARKQLAGRGLGENVWKAEPGKNLTFSYFLKPEGVNASNQYVINMVVANTIRGFLEKKTERRVLIKWPNDILVDEKKISGILIQHALMGEEIMHSVIGVGLNVNQIEFPEFRPEATSMRLLTGNNHVVDNILGELVNDLSIGFQNLENKEYHKTQFLNNLYRIGQWKQYVVKGKKTNACILGINETGLLRVKDEDHEIYECDLKELVYLY